MADEEKPFEIPEWIRDHRAQPVDETSIRPMLGAPILHVMHHERAMCAFCRKSWAKITDEKDVFCPVIRQANEAGAAAWKAHMRAGMKMSEFDRTPEYQQKIDQHGPFALSKTLLGGQPDRNRRTIWNMETMEQVEVLNAEMAEWPHGHDLILQQRVKDMNAGYLAARKMHP